MQLVDWIVIGVLALSLLIGSLVGFGKLLKIFTGGIVGVIISVVVTYFCIGIVSSWGFVQELMAKLLTVMKNADNTIVNFLIDIGIEKIILAVAIFIIVQIVRIIIVNVIKGVVEAENAVMKVVNRFFGAVFMVAIACMIALLVFHVIDLIGGNTEQDFINSISGSKLRIDYIFEHNPLQYIIQRIIPSEPEAFVG